MVPTLPLSGMQLLLVDDDADILEVICTVLEQAGAAAVCVGSAQEALTKLTGQRFDAVVSDLSMPGEDGLWLAQQVDLSRSTLPNPGVHMVAMTAYSDMRAEAMQAGFEAFLTKPFDGGALVKTLVSMRSPA